MADDKVPNGEVTETVSTKRRVYDLPNELVERILEFQKDRGLPSEVEAARRLLDQALKSRDTRESLIGRFLSRLTPGTEPSEAAADVLVGHPLVKGLDFMDDDSVRFRYQRPNETAQLIWPRGESDIRINPSPDRYADYPEIYLYDPKAKIGERLRKKPDDDEVPF